MFQHCCKKIENFFPVFLITHNTHTTHTLKNVCQEINELCYE